MALFGFDGSCEELQSWLEDQAALLRTLQPRADNLEVMQLKFEVQSPWSQGGILPAWPCCLLYSCPPSSPCSCLSLRYSCASVLYVNYSPVRERGARGLALNFF